MSQDLVSLLTPCYNTGKYIHRLLDSVSSQTYPNIEMIIMDDGSTDNSKSIVNSYIPKFEARGYKLEYFYQNNSGQSVAIQNGLHHVHGTFISWPDSDDYYASNRAIEMMVAALKKASSRYAVVRCMQRVVGENSLNEIYVEGNNFKPEGKIFDDCLFFQNGFYIQPISFMVRYSALYETTGLNIYTCKKGGQNWQLLLPIFYTYECLTIKEILTNILCRTDSHSRTKMEYEDLVKKSLCFETVAVETIKRIKLMPSGMKEQYIRKLQYNGLRERLKMSYNNRKRSDYVDLYHKWICKFGDARLVGNRLTYLAVMLHLESIWDLCRNYRVNKQ